MSFAGDVWQTLSKIDCSKHVEKKQNLSYLSWAWAWGILMEEYPESEFEFLAPEERPDGTMQIWTKVTIRQGEHSLSRLMWLPVMDHRNKAIPHPDSFAINSSRMRCLTKCLAMFGLGHYIYAGEDLPNGAEVEVDLISDEQAAELKGLIEQTHTDVQRFLIAFDSPKSVDQMKADKYAQAKTLLLKKKGMMEAAK